MDTSSTVWMRTYWRTCIPLYSSRPPATPLVHVERARFQAKCHRGVPWCRVPRVTYHMPNAPRDKKLDKEGGGITQVKGHEAKMAVSS